jgi:hypothetical protein
MANIQIYGSIENASIHFDNSTVSLKPLNSVEAVAHPIEVDRIIIRSTVPKNNGTFQTYFRRFYINRVENKDGVILTTTLGMDRTQVLAYLNAEFNKSLAETNAVYKGTWDAATNTPDLTGVTHVAGDWYYVTVAGTYLGVDYGVNDQIRHNSVDFDLIEDTAVTVDAIENAALSQYDAYVDPTFVGTSTGSTLKPWSSLLDAINNSNSGESILVKGSNVIAAEIVLPHGIKFYGVDGSEIKFASYSASNGDIFSFVGTGVEEMIFKNIEFKNAGGYGLYIKKTVKTTIENCKFQNNGWDGTLLNTVVPSATYGLLGYDSTNTDLQAFYAGSHASNGGAMRIEEATQLLIVGNTVTNNLRGIRVSDCGIGGAGVITRNQSTQNIESGIYLSVGALGGCQNVTVMMNVSSYNANNGLLVIGGINNKFSQNDVTGNWNAGFCNWGASNSTLRDSSLYDNNRSVYNGIGNTGDAKASIQINEAYSLLGIQIAMNPNFRFICEILDTQVHNTGLGSNTERIGFLITSGVGALADNDKNIIKIDDVGFIGQDYAIDLSEVDVTNLRLSLGDNSYQSIALGAVKSPLSGNYSELPFSNHVMEVPSVDVVVDTLKQSLSLRESVGGNTINVYAINELQSVISGSTIQILQANTDKIQLRGLTHGNIYINGVVAGNNLNSANDSLNAAFSMDLVEYKDVLVNEVGINGDESSGGSLPAIANNWYISYGSQAGTQNTGSTIGNNFKNFQPHYNGEALEKGHEFIWTANLAVDFVIGTWGGAEVASSAATALLQSSWSQGFRYEVASTSWNEGLSNGVDITASGDVADKYVMTNGQMALRFGQDGYLYLFEVVSGGYTLVGKSNSTVAGTSVMIQFGGYMTASFPNMVERTETWEIVHDFDGSQNGEWSNGLEEHTVIKSRMSVSPGDKVTLDLNYAGSQETIGIGYNSASTGVNNAEDELISRFFYNSSELLKQPASDWTWNTSAGDNYYNPNGDHSSVGYWNQGSNLGLISFRYNSDNTLELWSEVNNELIATKVTPLSGSAFNIHIGSNENNHTADRIPLLTKYALSATDLPAAISSWWYIESPDGTFFYPLFQSAAEANAVDIIEGGSGTNHTHTFLDDPTSSTWYMPDTNGTHVGTAAPQGGVFGNSINVVWNEQVTGADSGFVPTFNNITYNVQEGSAINIQYKPQGDTSTYNVTGVPTGYADNGYAIIGTAEDITNGYGQSVTHTINVTKANSFGSVQGTITINVLANLTGNEFTVIEKETGGVVDAIKFTQDGGNTELDFNTVTFAAGSTYKFFIDHASVESNDTLMVTLVSDSTAYTTGVTISGTYGTAGSYVQFVVPSDVPPVKLTWTSGTGEVVDTPMTVSGSTYTEGVTGITQQGPAASQTGTNGADAGTFGWATIDDTLTAGQRLVLNGTFLKDVVDEMSPSSYVQIGIKDTDFNSASISSSSFINGSYISLEMNASGVIGIYAAGGYFNVADIVANYSAFIEISSDGNSIRFGATNDSSTDNAVTTAYSDYNGSGRIDSGNQGYGITNAEIAIRFHNGSSASDLDANEIDWTGLSEVSIPVAASSYATTTNFAKALSIVGTNTHLYQTDPSTNQTPMKHNQNSSEVGLIPVAGATSSSNNSYPWMMGGVYYLDPANSAQMFSLSQSAVTGQRILLGYETSGTATRNPLTFYWGTSNSDSTPLNGIQFDMDMPDAGWYSFYIDQNGVRLNETNVAEAAAMLRFKQVDLQTGAVSTLTGTWTQHGTGSTTSAVVSQTRIRMGKPSGSTSAKADQDFKIANFVVSSVRADYTLPTDAEIELFINDPNKWRTDYRVGTQQRFPHHSTSQGLYDYDSYNGYMTQQWSFGDHQLPLAGLVTHETFPSLENGFRAVGPNVGKASITNGTASDSINVTIPGLS